MTTVPPPSMSGPWVTAHEEAVVLDALRHGWYGDKAYAYCELFEREFARYHDRAYALMTPNCTTALHLLLAAIGIGPGDEVIVPDCTWIGSSACIAYQRAATVFADIDSRHWCLTPESLARAITPRTKAVIVVDLYGNMPDWDGLRAEGAKHGIHVIEDAAEALGSKYNGVRAGKFGVASAFSFHRTKTLTTGEGGMLLLDDHDLFKRCMLLRDHGRTPGTYFNTEVAFKYMPSNLQAALGYAQFQRIDELVGRKRWIWQQYRERLADVPDIELNPEPPNVVNGVWCTALIFGKSHGLTRDKAMQSMSALGLPSRPFFYPLSSLPAYGSMAETYRDINHVAYDVSDRGINLSCALNISEAQIVAQCNAVRNILGLESRE